MAHILQKFLQKLTASALFLFSLYIGCQYYIARRKSFSRLVVREVLLSLLIMLFWPCRKCGVWAQLKRRGSVRDKCQLKAKVWILDYIAIAACMLWRDNSLWCLGAKPVLINFLFIPWSVPAGFEALVSWSACRTCRCSGQ